jgi:hypothetical protein
LSHHPISLKEVHLYGHHVGELIPLPFPHPIYPFIGKPSKAESNPKLHSASLTNVLANSWSVTGKPRKLLVEDWMIFGRTLVVNRIYDDLIS